MALRGLVSMMNVKLQSRKPKREMPALGIRPIQGVEKKSLFINESLTSLGPSSPSS